MRRLAYTGSTTEFEAISHPANGLRNESHALIHGIDWLKRSFALTVQLIDGVNAVETTLIDSHCYLSYLILTFILLKIGNEMCGRDKLCRDHFIRRKHLASVFYCLRRETMPTTKKLFILQDLFCNRMM